MNDAIELARYGANIAANAAAMAERLGHRDTQSNLEELSRRVTDPLSRVVVCGGFKQGKSSLVNALLNGRLTPSDAAIATAVPVTIAHGELSAAIYLEGEAGNEVRHIDVADLADVVHGKITTVDQREIVGALIRVPRSLLARGVIVVDTPPVTGGLASAEAIRVLTEIRRARAFVYVTDASQELTAPELEFIEHALRLCPSMVCCLTKTDLYPEWQRILRASQAHLDAIDVATPIIPVSSTLRQRGIRLGRPELARASGYGLVSSFLTGNVLATATHANVRLLAETVARATSQMAEPVAAELAALQQPSDVAALRERAEAAKARVTAFAAPGRSWERVLKRELRRLNDDSRYHVQVELKELERWAMERIDADDPARFWLEFESRLQRATSKAIVDHLAFIRENAQAAVEKVAEAVAQEADDLGIALEDFRVPFSASDLELDDAEFGGVVRSAQTGVVAMRFAAAAGLTIFGALAPISIPIAGVVALGAAVTSGAVFTIGGHKTGLERRRQAARQAAQKYLRDARLVAEKASNDAVTFTQDQLVEEFERLVRELNETVDAELEALSDAQLRHDETRPARIEELKKTFSDLQLIHSHAEQAAIRATA